MRVAHVTTCLLSLSLSPLASALSWPQWLPEIDSLIVRRQDSSSSTSGATATQTASAEASSTDAAKATDLNTADATSSASDTASGTATETGDASSTGTDTDTSSGTKTSSKGKTSSVSVSSGAQAGSAVIQSPVTTLTSALYKIGEWVTFNWNYTNVEITPTAVDVVVSASTSSFASTWTLTSNMTFETDASFIWDTAAYQTQALKNQQPLVVEMYTLYIYDAESSVTATAGAGELTADAALTFGLYTGQAYTPLQSGWVCATCSAALSDNDKRALGFMLSMVGITVLSFTWFVTGLW